MMQKGTAIVGMLLSFVLGILVMFGINRSQQGGAIHADKAVAAADNKGGGASDHSGSPIPITKDDPSWGNADALVTIVEISDFQCPFCSRVGPTMKKIKDTYGPEKVRIVWKHNPLPFHKEAGPAHEASQAVFALGGSEAFWKFHDLAFQNQKELTPANFEKWAAASGVDAAKFKAELAKDSVKAKIKADLDANRKIGATGTPAFRINGVTVSGAQPFDSFKTTIDAELKKADDLLKKGTAKKLVSLRMTEQNFKNQPTPEKKEAKPAAEDTTVWRVPVMKDDPFKGSPDALVTIVEWSDFQCPFCSRVEPTMKKLVETYGNDLRIVWKDNALPFHNQAKPAANLARFAYEKGGNDLFWKAHELLFENQKDLGTPTYEKIAGQLGLNAAEVKAAIDSNKYEAKISQSMELANDFQARGTPHFFVNGRRVSGAQPFEKFDELVKTQLATAKALVAKGVARANVYDELMKSAKGPDEPEKRDVAAPTAKNPVKGNPAAKVVIQEFSDFQCPFCSRVNPTMKEIQQEYGDKVQIVWRNMPLPFHKEAPLAAEAAQEAFTQKGSAGFWAYHDKLFENQKALQREDLDRYASELGLDMAKFKAALDGRTHEAHVKADVAVAEKAGVRGTPAFTVNGYFLSGAQPLPAFKKLIDLALKEAK
jgi:protein-disulfide isomerase